MNKQKFAEYLRSPEKIEKATFEEIEDIIKEYPYFQSAHTLLAKAAKIQNSKNANTYITNAAVFATDRALLKRYLNDQLIFLNPLTVHESHEAEREREVSEVLKANKTAAVQLEKVSKEESPKELKPPKDSKPSASKSIPDGYLQPEDLETGDPSELDLMIEELYHDMEELKINRAKLKEIEDKLIEEEAVDEAVDIAIKKAEAKQTESDNSGDESNSKTEITEEPVKPIKPSESKSARISSISSEVEISKSLTDNEEEDDDETVEIETASAFDNEVKPQTEEISESGSIDDSKSEEAKEKQSYPPTSEDISDIIIDSKGSSKEDKNAIIDEFIKNNPSIGPAKQSSSNEDLSSGSIDLHPDIASEYLAEIYLEQGRKERAIQIYNSLIVRFPEKSVYFADIIKKINEQI